MTTAKPPVGSVTWFDLTVKNADEIRDFYAAVVGWDAAGVPMGDYQDFSMNAPDSGDPMTGICFARGENQHLPPVWMIYVNVADIESALAKVENLGGKRIGDLRIMGGHGRYCAIEDPAGAVMTLFEPE